VLIADEHFTAGRLQLAGSLCIELWEEKIRTPMLTAVLGEILLLRNRPAEAEPLLRKAIDQQGGNPRLIASLAECLRRSNRLAEAAEQYRKLGRIAFADKLRRLAGGGQYLLPDGAAVMQTSPNTLSPSTLTPCISYQIVNYWTIQDAIYKNKWT